jgi:hypothetical protein
MPDYHLRLWSPAPLDRGSAWHPCGTERDERSGSLMGQNLPPPSLGRRCAGSRVKESGSHPTRRWSEMDSNLRFRNRFVPISGQPIRFPSRLTASRPGTGSSNPFSLQQTIRLSPDFTRVSEKLPVFRHIGGDAGRQGRERHHVEDALTASTYPRRLPGSSTMPPSERLRFNSPDGTRPQHLRISGNACWNLRRDRTRCRATSRETLTRGACVQPDEDQSSPGGHEADAQTLAGLPHPVQRQRGPHHDEAGQAQAVHAEENVSGEHRPCRRSGFFTCVTKLPRFRGRATGFTRLTGALGPGAGVRERAGCGACGRCSVGSARRPRGRSALGLSVWGMNVGGIPFSDSSNGFWVVAGLIAAIFTLFAIVLYPFRFRFF